VGTTRAAQKGTDDAGGNQGLDGMQEGASRATERAQKQTKQVAQDLEGKASDAAEGGRQAVHDTAEKAGCVGLQWLSAACVAMENGGQASRAHDAERGGRRGWALGQMGRTTRGGSSAGQLGRQALHSDLAQVL
jgi:hypothetical protein